MTSIPSEEQEQNNKRELVSSMQEGKRDFQTRNKPRDVKYARVADTTSRETLFMGTTNSFLMTRGLVIMTVIISERDCSSMLLRKD